MQKISQDITHAIAYTSALCTLYVSHKRAPVLLFQKFVYCRPVFVIFLTRTICNKKQGYNST